MTDADAKQPQAENAQTDGNCARIAKESVNQVVTEGSRAHLDRAVLARQNSSTTERKGKTATYFTRPGEAFHAKVETRP